MVYLSLSSSVRILESSPVKSIVTRVVQVSVLAALAALALPSYADYSKHPEAKKFVADMVSKNGFSKAELNTWLESAEKKQSILDAMARPAEKSKTWKEYRPIFMVPLRIENGEILGGK